MAAAIVNLDFYLTSGAYVRIKRLGLGETYIIEPQRGTLGEICSEGNAALVSMGLPEKFPCCWKKGGTVADEALRRVLSRPSGHMLVAMKASPLVALLQTQDGVLKPAP